MSFCFNFDVPAQTTSSETGLENKPQNGEKYKAAKSVSN